MILWAGAALPTTFVSPEQVTASVDAAQLTSTGSRSVAIQAYPNPDAPVSAGANFVVTPVPPLTLSSIYPSIIPVNSGTFTLVARGLSFTADAVIRWNGSPLPTSAVSSSELRAQVPAADVATTGSVSISVQNSAGAGVLSATLPIFVQTPTTDAVALQITPSHDGRIEFNSPSFPPLRSWSVNVGGTPSYPLIADGKVFVTVKAPGNYTTGSVLLALDQFDGHTVWGPLTLPQGSASAAYDGGKIAVITAAGSMSATIQSYDGKTGALDWSRDFDQEIGFESAPTATNGVLYLVDTDTNLYAIDESNGTTLWQADTGGGSGSTPAITSQGAFTSEPCNTDGFALGTGVQLFADRKACSGGGGATAVVANDVFYALQGDLGNGISVDAGTGAQLGTFTADAVPAFDAATGYFLQAATLNARSLSDNSVLWSFSGDGALTTSPLVVDQFVIVGSSIGNVYALDAATGAQVWTSNTAGAAVAMATGTMPSGMAAGDGLLVVPAGNTVSAYTLSANP